MTKELMSICTKNMSNKKNKQTDQQTSRKKWQLMNRQLTENLYINGLINKYICKDTDPYSK